MAARRLSAEERALWAKVTAGVRPIVGGQPSPEPSASSEGAAERSRSIERPAEQAGTRVSTALDMNGIGKESAGRRPVSRPVPGETLDGGWDRRLGRGLVAPDVSIDLHGHTLPSAHAALDASLTRAVASGARLILVVTGHPPRGERGHGPPRRGAIRAAIGDWLAISPHAGQIAAVRNAHPRHGGGGALYVVMRRRRERVL